jgi:hypothetical protein
MFTRILIILVAFAAIGNVSLREGVAAGEPAGLIACLGDDAYEDNDSLASARAVDVPFAAAGLVVCAGDEDDFLLPAEALHIVQADACFNHDDGNVELDLFGADKAAGPIAFAHSMTNHERIAYLGPDDAAYGLQITIGAGRSDLNSYDLLISTGLPATDIGDANDEDGVNAIDAAVILQYSAALIDTLPSSRSANANGNCAIDAIDASLVLQYDAGLIGFLTG